MTAGHRLGQALATIALGPVLLAQGRHVRRTTPRLPEPSGARQGVAGDGEPLRVLIVGDSAAAGVGVATQAQALSGQLAAALSPTCRLSWKLIAQSGYGSAELLERLAAEPAERFDLAITSLGVNDVTQGIKPARWLTLQGRLVELLTSRFQVRHVLLASVPPMHVFPALPQPLRWYLGVRAKRLNHALLAWASQHANCEVVTASFPLEPALMAADGFHPGPAAYAMWARHIARHIAANRQLGAPNAASCDHLREPPAT